MSLITTCPSCGTSFRITPEQLSAHRGDVRCGNCQHIFSALKHLTEVVSPPPAPTPSEPSAAAFSEETSDQVEFTAAPQFEPVNNAQAEPEPILADKFEVEIEPTPENAHIEPVAEEEHSLEATADEELPEVRELHFDTETLDFEIETPEESPQPVTAIEENPPITEEIELTDHAVWVEDAPANVEESVHQTEPAPVVQESLATPAPSPAPEPIPAAVTESKPKRRVPTWALAILAVLLVLIGLAQTVYFLRNGIASRYPQAGPWLESFCQPLHCSIDLPHQAELLSIEDSDLKDDPEHEGVLILVSVLDNRASFTQAAPLLELTLTDTFDQPLLRRTFKPHEYLPAGISPDRGIAAGAQIPIRLNLSTDNIKPAGYRLYVKY